MPVPVSGFFGGSFRGFFGGSFKPGLSMVCFAPVCAACPAFTIGTEAALSAAAVGGATVDATSTAEAFCSTTGVTGSATGVTGSSLGVIGVTKATGDSGVPDVSDVSGFSGFSGVTGVSGVTATRFPHLEQNKSPSFNFWPHLEQNMVCILLCFGEID